MLESLNNIDVKILLLLNDWGPGFVDQCFRVITNKYTWIPFYLFFIFLLFRKFSSKQALLLFGLLILAVASADMISVHLFKNVFERLRPCHANIDGLSLVAHKCGGQFGFVSSHAANSFAIAGVLFAIFRSAFPMKWIFAWAALVAYSRVYLGVHYPADILVGAILGCLIACAIKIFLLPKVLK